VKVLVRGAGAIGVALLIAACGDPLITGRDMGEPAAELPAFDVNPVPREQLRTGGTLRWPLRAFPAQWNLALVPGPDRDAADDVLRAVLPYVMRCDEKAVPHPDPDYLTDVKVSRTSGRQIVTYTLNPRAVWSDGTPITYRDYLAQAGAMSGRDRRFRSAAVPGYDHIEKVERGADDHQVVVTFARPLAAWPELFGPLYPAATSSDPEAFGRGWAGRIGVTAGPFAPYRVDGTAGTVTVTRNPRWWGRPARLDRIVYRAMDAGAIPGAFAAGEVDVMELGPDAAAYRLPDLPRGTVVRAAAGSAWRGLTFDISRPPLSDPRVRQALALAIDRTAVARSGFAGLGRPARILNNHFFMNTQEGYQDNSEGLSVHDPAEAMRLLDEAGWRRRGAYRVKNGATLALRFAAPSGAPVALREAELIQAMLAPIGVRLDLRAPPAEGRSGEHAAPRGIDITGSSWPAAPFPVSSLWPVFARLLGGRAGADHTGVGSARIDGALGRALGELDPARARRFANDADTLLWREMFVLPLYQCPQLVAARETLANFGARGFYDLAYEDIGFTR
jgi:peptide/nickel transport system substrate-binding protein